MIQTKTAKRRIRFWAYNNGSASVSGLLEKVKGLMLKHEQSRYKYEKGDLVINWGFGRALDIPVLNKPSAVRLAISKRRTFDALKGKVPIPEWTEDQKVAQKWIAEGHRVLGRDQDSGAQGHGITVYNSKSADISRHLFYVKYIPKKREFRIHVFNGSIIFQQEKLRRDGAKEASSFNQYVRSHERGWVFAFHHLNETPVPDSVRDVAIQAVAGLGLDFGACDIGFHDKSGPVLYEVNTAPGIEETSLEAYAQAILNVK